MKKNPVIRIFVDAHVFDGEFQGTRTFIKGIYTILARKDDVQLYLGAHNTDNLKKDFSESGNVHFVKYKSTSGFWRLLYETPAIIKKYNIQYAHFQYISPLQKGCKFIVTIHDLLFIDFPREFPFLYRSIRSLIFKISAVNADIVTTVSQYSKSSIQKHFGIKPDKIYIISNGVSADFFQAYDKSASRKFIYQKYGVDKFLLYVSRIEPRKNHIFLVKAFIELKLYEQGFYLILIGHKSIAVSELDTMFNNLPQNVKQYIFITHEINGEDLLEFYRAASIFIYPSKAEGFGIPPLEAAALRIPVICSNTTGMSDFYFFGTNLIDPHNYEAFRNKLSDIVARVPDQGNLGNIAELIRNKYTWEESAERLYEVIKKDNSSILSDV
jgi:glycosyltransferase involved in cell wall biosynthesis